MGGREGIGKEKMMAGFYQNALYVYTKFSTKKKIIEGEKRGRKGSTEKYRAQ